ncbi:hypothetical protein [Sanyastnella coralliicola]|uniref:hypothetical protein n=1 Tax=Sanyastnella coralliicola TaxID=3069118 RepID=UPI0027B9F3E1|nr:hypothetical protein [Longitalea sp. SCSIO 12813]
MNKDEILQSIADSKTIEDVDAVVEGVEEQEILDAAEERRAAIQNELNTAAGSNQKPKAQELIAQIKEADTVEKVKAILEGEERKTVLDAGTARIAELEEEESDQPAYDIDGPKKRVEVLRGLAGSHGLAYFKGATPELPAAQADQLIADGYALPYKEEEETEE